MAGEDSEIKSLFKKADPFQNGEDLPFIYCGVSMNLEFKPAYSIAEPPVTIQQAMAAVVNAPTAALPVRR